MLTLIRNAQVFAPESLGRREVLVAGTKIAAVAERIDLQGEELSVIDADGAWLMPGIVDALTHPCGGGGEGGFANRTGEISLSAFVRAGVTSPIGALGTDSIARSLDVLYGSVMSLRARGLDAWMYTGSYRVPANTITGDITRDIVMIAPVIGIGEVAVSDHRSSQPAGAELRRIAAEARLGGVLTGCRGAVLVHVGEGSSRLAPLRAALDSSDLPVTSFYPTHCNRNRPLLDEAIAFARAGAFIDFTASTLPEFIAAGEVPALDALGIALADGVPAGQVTLSSDAGGSLPYYEDGELKGLQAATPDCLLALIFETARTNRDLLPQVIAAMTSNPASALGLAEAGRIAPQANASLLLIDPRSSVLSDVMCRGRWLMRAGILDDDHQRPAP